MDSQNSINRSDYAKELIGDVTHLESTITGLKKELLDLVALSTEHTNEIEVINSCISILQDMVSSTKGRILNVILRGYDLPLQGATIYHKMERVVPETRSFTRSTFHKKS